jgi:hypothetical protein
MIAPMSDFDHQDYDHEGDPDLSKPGDRPGEPGAERDEGGSANTPPPVPDPDDDTALGDTDQLSDDPA